MITKPTFLVDEKKCRTNIQKIADKAKRNNVIFRAHFKTHQSLAIGRWFKDAGVEKITVSSLDMARYFAPEWNDITVAFPVNFLEIDTINELASKIQLNVVIINLESVDFLLQHLQHPIGFFIKIDVGYKRTGILPDNLALVDAILERTAASDNLNFLGFLGHAGHSYKSSSFDEIEATHKESIARILPFRERYSKDYPNLILSVGDTPTCSVVEDFSMVDEIRPGNFVFYDIQQTSIGSNTMEDIAIAMACPIVAIHPDKNELIMHGGGVHFAKDAFIDPKLGTIYGRIVAQTENGWGEILEGIYVKSLSQEHGILAATDEVIKNYKVGDIVYILPVHSCLTANCFKSYQLLSGEVIERF